MDSQPTINPETGSTVPSAPPAPNRQNRRKRVGKPVKRDNPTAPSLHQLRMAVFQNASQCLAVLRLISEEAPTGHPDRQEISDAMRVIRLATVDAGLELIRPIVAQLKALKPFDPPTDEKINGTQAVGGTDVDPAGVHSASC